MKREVAAVLAAAAPKKQVISVEYVRQTYASRCAKPMLKGGVRYNRARTRCFPEVEGGKILFRIPFADRIFKEGF